MSYSFNVRASSKDGVRDGVVEKLRDVVEQQPIHAHDVSTAGKTVAAVLELIGPPGEGEEYSVTVHGSCWQRDDVFKGVSVGVDISHQQPIAPTIADSDGDDGA